MISIFPIEYIAVTIGFLLLMMSLALLMKSRWFKGIIGEWLVRQILKWRLDDKHYHVINNVTIPFNCSTTQIDHIIVSPFGIFVIETKNMKGWIFGIQRQKYWTQKIYRHHQTFQNPLHQNYKHVLALVALLGIEQRFFHSVVVFLGGSTFKSSLPDNVTQGCGVIQFIKSHNTKIITPEKCTETVKKIAMHRLPNTRATSKAHIRNQRKYMNKNKNKSRT